MSDSGRYICINIGYLVVWGFITFISSYNFFVQDLDFGFLSDSEQDYHFIVIPLIIWMIAYFIDFAYTALRKESDEMLSRQALYGVAVSMSIFLLMIVFILGQSSYIASIEPGTTPSSWWASVEVRAGFRTGCLVLMFMVILSMKWSSLTVLEYKEELRKV